MSETVTGPAWSELPFDDAWSLALLAPGGSPARAATAAAPPDPEVRAAALAAWLLLRAARDGSTWLPAGLLLPALAALDVADPAAGVSGAIDLGVLAALEDDALALPALALAEEEVAEQVQRLELTEGALTLVLGASGEERDRVVRDRAAVDLVIDMAETVGLEDFTARLEQVPDGGSAVLAGDPDIVQVGPGALLRDLAAADVIPVERVPPVAGAASALDLLDRSLREGRLPSPEQLQTSERSVVVVPVDSDEDAARRVRQVVEVSIPRAFAIDASEVLVLTALRRGVAGAAALDAVLACGARTLHETGRGADAVVLVLPGSAAGTLRREGLVGGVTRAGRHVSLVTGMGAALPAAAALPARPRRTRLEQLLRAD